MNNVLHILSSVLFQFLVVLGCVIIVFSIVSVTEYAQYLMTDTNLTFWKFYMFSTAIKFSLFVGGAGGIISVFFIWNDSED